MRTQWRQFLQSPDTEVDSYVVVHIPDQKQDEAAMLKIADCDRRVMLWFSWGSAKGIATSRKKIAVLREALDRLEAGLERLYQEEKKRV